MLSIRCKMVVKSVLEKMDLHYNTLELGEVEIKEFLNKQDYELLREELLKYNLELMDDKKRILIEKIKNVVVEMVHYSEELPKTNFSVYITEKLNYDYNYLS